MNASSSPQILRTATGKAPGTIRTCPKCGRKNSAGAYFCTSCHQVLIHRCPNCWHEQESGGRCEKCGTNFALYWEMAFERAIERENRIWWDGFKSAALNLAGFVFWPITSLGGLLRYLIARLAARAVSNH